MVVQGFKITIGHNQQYITKKVHDVVLNDLRPLLNGT